MKCTDHVELSDWKSQRLLAVREAERHDILDDFSVSQGMALRVTPASHFTRRVDYRLLQNVSNFLIGMRSCHVLLALTFIATMGILPSLAHAAGVELWVPCVLKGKARSEGRTTYIGDYLNAKTTGMRTSDIEDLYCVTRVKCIALGHCKATSPEEQAAADKLKREIAAEESRLQHERQAKAAQAERERKKAEAAAAAEKARRQKLAAAEAQRLRLSTEQAQRLVEVREDARKKMPAQPEKCTVVYPAYAKKLDFTPIILLKSKAEKDYAALDRSKMCNGHPGTLDPLQCTNQSNSFGLIFASCSAMKRCPERQESKRCSRASVQ